MTEGELPTGEDEIALDEGTADKAGYEIGDTVTLVTPGEPPTMKAKLTGLVEFGSQGGLVGATLTVFDQQAMQDLFFEGKDVYTSISVDIPDGASQAAVTAEVAEGAPGGRDRHRRRRVRRGEQEQHRRRPEVHQHLPAGLRRRRGRRRAPS